MTRPEKRKEVVQPTLSDTKNIMIDIETLGVTNKAHIISIGLCSFSLQEGFEPKKDFAKHYSLGLVEQKRNIDTCTLQFWLSQPADLFSRNLASGYGLAKTLEMLADDINLARGNNKVNIWCNGASFDFAILKDAFEQYGQTVPWHFAEENCMRAIKALLSDNADHEVMRLVDATLAKKGIITEAHDALSDVIWQAEYITQALKKLHG